MDAFVAAMSQSGQLARHLINEACCVGVHGVPDKAGTPPSDAIVLFDGKNFNEWESGKGGEVKWKLVDGAMEVVRGGGTIRTKRKLGYGQYHVEWRTPEIVKGSGRAGGTQVSFPWAGLKFRFLIPMRTQPIRMVRRGPFTTVTLPWSTPAGPLVFGKPTT